MYFNREEPPGGSVNKLLLLLLLLLFCSYSWVCICGNWSDENKSKTKKTLDCEMMDVSSFFVLIHLIPVSDQDRFSPYFINTISSRQVMRIKKISIVGLLVDLAPNSPNQHHENCMANSKKNY